MAISHSTLAHRFIDVCRAAGGSVDVSYAQTGSIYVTVERYDAEREDITGSIRVRFADHGECYCREDISVDPETGAGYMGAIEATIARTGLDLSRSLRACRAAETRRAKKIAAIDAMLSARAVQPAADADARSAFVERWIADRYPDFDTIHGKARKRIRRKAIEAYLAQQAA